MTRRDAIAEAVYRAVDDLNDQLPRAQRLARDPATPVMGPRATLDSLGLVNLIASIQARLEESLGVRLSLVDGDLLAGGSPQATTLAGFIDYIDAAVTRKSDG